MKYLKTTREPLLALFLTHLDQQQTISRQEAQRLHQKLGRAGYQREEHYELAQALTQRPIKSLTSLTHEEAKQLDELITPSPRPKEVVCDEEPSAIGSICDEEALAILF